MNDIERENWLKERKNYIGGSDISAILGLNTYRSAIDVYLDKLSPEIDTNMSEAAKWGILLEDTVAKVYEEKTNLKVEVQPNVIYHPEHKFLAANIDRWVDGRKYILECKTTSFMNSKGWGEQYTDQVPESYLCQVAHYAAICDVPKIDIAVLIGGQDFRIYTYNRNKEFENKIHTIACNFWNNHVLKGVPPEARSIEDVSALYPRSTGLTLEADNEISEKVTTLKALKSEEKRTSEAIKKLQFEIQNYMKKADVLMDAHGNCLVTWKNTVPRFAFNLKLLQKEHGDIYDKCADERPGSRVFLIK